MKYTTGYFIISKTHQREGQRKREGQREKSQTDDFFRVRGGFEWEMQ